MFSRANKRVQFGYGLNYLIDVEHAIIVDVEATPARTYDEVASTMTMIEVVNRHWNGTPYRHPKGTPLTRVFFW